ncbi:MAG: hypothetical protein ACSLEN_04770 [Candidatus Malihini olakiniferum]
MAYSPEQWRAEQSLPGYIASERQPLESDGKNQDQQQSKPKIGHCLPEHDSHHGAAIDSGITEHHSQYPTQRDRHQQRQQQRNCPQFQGDRHTLPNQLYYGVFKIERRSEIDIQRGPEPMTKLRGKRLIQPISDANLSNHLCSSLRSGNRCRQIAGKI